MLSSVPITIGEEKHSLQFLAGDIVEIEDDLDKPIGEIMAYKSISRIGVFAKILYYGLKRGTDARGNPMRELPQNREGLLQAQEYARMFTVGKAMDVSTSEIGSVVLKALAAGGWYNAREITEKEADTPVPQGDGAPKNSGDPGSNPSSR